MRWRRAARIVLGCAVLGAVTMVAAAWGLARWGRVGGAGYSMTTMVDAEGGVWMYAEELGFGMRRVRSVPFNVRFGAEGVARSEPGPRIVEQEGPRRRRWLAAEGVPGGDLPRHGWVDDACGWPMIALACEMKTVAPTYMGRSRVGAVRWGVPMAGLGAMRAGRPRMWALPLRPVWPGFVVNTGVFAVGWFVVFAAPAAVRRWNRRRNGLCLGCGYDLRGSPGRSACPECGAELRGVAAHGAAK